LNYHLLSKFDLLLSHIVENKIDLLLQRLTHRQLHILVKDAIDKEADLAGQIRQMILDQRKIKEGLPSVPERGKIVCLVLAFGFCIYSSSSLSSDICISIFYLFTHFQLTLSRLARMTISLMRRSLRRTGLRARQRRSRAMPSTRTLSAI
jgi:hypothetical protein